MDAEKQPQIGPKPRIGPQTTHGFPIFLTFLFSHGSRSPWSGGPFQKQVILHDFWGAALGAPLGELVERLWSVEIRVSRLALQNAFDVGARLVESDSFDE